MGEALCEIAIVGEDEQAFGLRVKTADIEKTRQMRWQQIEDRVADLRVASRGNETRRLMQHNVEPTLTVDEFPVDLDVIALSGLRAEVSADLAVDHDAAGGDQFIAVPARTQTGRGKIAVEAHGSRATA